MNKNKGEIIIYNPTDTVRIEVLFERETVWLTQSQLGLLFGVDRTVIVRHIGNIYRTGELEETATCAKNAQVQSEGKRMVERIQNYSNLDMILSVGYRVNSRNATAIYTNRVSEQFQLDIDRHNAQYRHVEIHIFNKAHDRFLIIDDKVYHIGASLKDLGKKWFAFSLLQDITPKELLSRI